MDPRRIRPLLLLPGLWACAAPAERPAPPTLEGAVADLERETSANPDDGEAWLTLGEARLALAQVTAAQEGDPGPLREGAATAFERAMERLPADARPRLGLAGIHESRGDLAGAATLATEAAALAPPSSEMRRRAGLLLARVLVARLEAEESLEPARRAALDRGAREALRALDGPPLPEAILLRASLAGALGQVEEAREIAGRGLEGFPEETALHLFLQESYGDDLGPDPGASTALVDRYEALHELHPESGTTLRFLAVARALAADQARRAGRWSEAAEGFSGAERAFERCGVDDPGGPGADALRAGICLGSQAWCRLKTGEFERAGRLFLEAASRGTLDHPDQAGTTAREGIDALARAWLDAGEPARAMAFLEGAVATDPDSSAWCPILGEVSFRAALAEEAAGREEAARALFARALANFERALREGPADLPGSSVCALLLARHSPGDLERAERMLRTVASRADARLAIDGLPEEERLALSRTASEAWETLGILYFDERHDADEARRFFRRSLEYTSEPGTRLRWYLDKVGNGTEAPDAPPRDSR